ncbi:MAG TPA: flagellar basal-body MS-ring/collar protein FliF [Pseudomonadales bacterium]
MAELPVQKSTAGTSLNLPGIDFLRGAAGLPAVRQMVLVFALAGSVALAVAAVLWMRSPDYRPVSAIESAWQANEIARVLETSGIDHKVDERSGMILVPQEDLYEARMKLAGAGSIDGRQLGYELLDQEQGFGVSQFMELARHRRSVEGELARSIATINAVQSARVLLATPKSTTFLRDQREPTASVTVRLVPGQSLTRDQVRGITNLVAGAVPELKPENVAVVDQTGKLLSQTVDDEALQQTERQLQYVARIEQQLQEKIRNILLPLIGPNRFSAEVTADVDFTRSEQAAEVFDAEPQAVRSEQVVAEENVGEPGPGGVPGALTNQPPETRPAQGAPLDGEAAPVVRRSRSETVRNYEMDRTLSYVQNGVGQIERLTVSVVVDDLVTVDAETGESVSQPWSEEELARLTTLVRSAVGFNEERGDLVSVVNSPFYHVPSEPVSSPPFWTQPWFFELMKQVLGALVLLGLVFGLLRPLFRNLSHAGAVAKEQQRLAALQAQAAAVAGLPAAVQGATTYPATVGPYGYGHKVEAVRGLVEEDPGRVAQVVKHWVSSNE